MVFCCFYEKERWSLWALYSGPCLPLQLSVFHVAPAYSPAHLLLPHWPCFSSWTPQDPCICWPFSLEWFPIYLCLLLTPTGCSDLSFLGKLLSVPFHWFCVLLVPYTSPISPITVTILYPFVWVYGWCFSPLLDSELDNDRSRLNCGPSLHSKHFLQFLAKKRDSP